MNKPNIRGQVGNGLLGGEIENKGLVGKLVNGASSTVSDLLCSLLGPSSLRGLLATSGCLSGIQLSTSDVFGTLPRFCYFFQNSSPKIQKCLNDAVVWGAIERWGIRNAVLEGGLGRCCAHYRGR